MTDEMTTARWVVLRWLPCMALAVALGVAAGGFRAAVGFLVGLQGMLVMGVLGWFVGRAGRGDPDRYWSFRQRIWLSLTVATVLGVAQVVVLSLIRGGPYDGPVEWLGNVVDGRLSEAGASVGGTGQVYRGYRLVLTGPAWVFFTLLDLLLGAFLFLATTVAGLGPSAAADGDAEAEGDDRAPHPCPACGRGGDEGDRACPGCGLDLAAHRSALSPAPSPRRGSRSAGFLLLATLAVLGVAAAAAVTWHRLATASDVLSLDNLHRNQRLVGRWQIVAGDGLESIPAEQRRFRVEILGMDDLVAVSEAERAFLIRLGPVGRRGEAFSGRLEPGPSFAWFSVPSTFGLSFGLEVEARVAADDASMRLVVERRVGEKRAFTARRVAAR